MKRYRSQSQRRLLELRTVERESSLLPTPSARDWKSGKSNQFGKNARPLNEWAEAGLLPTPTETANQLSPSMSKWAGCRRLQALAGGTGGRLSPLFVEWMMGFPGGWTD